MDLIGRILVPGLVKEGRKHLIQGCNSQETGIESMLVR
jgi:hypothetical protein